MYPYSERVDLAESTGGGTVSPAANYIRNSVKVTIDAMNGTISLYVVDKNDPMIRAWQRVFPDIFKSASECLRGCPRISVTPRIFPGASGPVHAVPHHNPDEFYAKEDAWRVPSDPSKVDREPSRPTT